MYVFSFVICVQYTVMISVHISNYLYIHTYVYVYMYIKKLIPVNFRLLHLHVIGLYFEARDNPITLIKYTTRTKSDCYSNTLSVALVNSFVLETCILAYKSTTFSEILCLGNVFKACFTYLC